MDINPAKIKKTAKILKVVMDVLFVSAIIATVIGFVAFCVIIAAPDIIFKLVSADQMSISLGLDGLVNYTLDPSMYEAAKLQPIFIAVVLTIILQGIALAIIFKQVSNILKTVREDRPFEEQNSKRLTIIGFVLIIGSVVFAAAQSAVVTALVYSLRIPNLEIRYSLDETLLITGFLILILAGVFKYGSFLQKEYDSTL